ncbi:MAG: RNA-splicing ligase RtcB [Gemmatimonadetes bacterium]|nr:MAG: RNA-splicing ligase RtcB [Gemmatimonadota bacterium]PYO67948.1 MAG: RNA-splicing ligase RtcB [Gemmatimonadota bacterium]PYO85837.1 MAG: RNA-splicing ligase RtcB [Gemmatimonadota bacterium]PYP62119.1 MAG: RNA-splicing ligase RtcB [Gemmatimonadota bacterium]
METSVRIERIDAYRWRVPRHGGMRTDGLIFADEGLMRDLEGDQAVQQVANVAHLPGIVGPAIAMPDIHWGYGFPIGGVAAFDLETGVVSPGGVGYDINCGVRLLATSLSISEARPRLGALVDALYRTIPSGVGASRSDVILQRRELEGVLRDGARWAVEHGFGVPADLEAIEANGTLEGADPGAVSDRAKERGKSQLGTVGSGNHFVEVGYVAETFDAAAAARLGLEPGRLTVFIHSGSRGLGYQVCDDSLETMLRASAKYAIPLPDKQLCCAPLASPEARHYWGAMNAAANFAFANRQLMAHYARRALGQVFGPEAAERTHLVYDVCHNIAKIERHEVAGAPRRVCVHRKGATRAFPPGHPELASRFRDLGQPVLIPGDMGRYSYVLLGTDGAYRETFGSTCHGAGRRLSRHQAKKLARPRNILRELEAQGILVRAATRGTVDEEMPEAYKDVSRVVDVVHAAGIGRKVVQLKPVAVVKG